MLSVTWHKALTVFLFAAPHVLLGPLVIILWKRRLYRGFPCFFAYVLYELVTFVLLSALYSLGAAKGYAYA
ncbi:MAG: hypothetical protein WCC78_14405, partial [Terriglobales bacterium]